MFQKQKLHCHLYTRFVDNTKLSTNTVPSKVRFSGNSTFRTVLKDRSNCTLFHIIIDPSCHTRQSSPVDKIAIFNQLRKFRILGTTSSSQGYVTLRANSISLQAVGILLLRLETLLFRISFNVVSVTVSAILHHIIGLTLQSPAGVLQLLLHAQINIYTCHIVKTSHPGVVTLALKQLFQNHFNCF